MNRRKIRWKQHLIEYNYLKLVLVAMFVPTFLVTACLYYLIWQTVAYELAIPELIAESLMPAFDRVNGILSIGLPVVFGLILFFAFRLAHRFAGPLDRLESDLDTMIKTHHFEKPLRVRRHDVLYPLIDKINQVLRKKHPHS